MIIKELKTLKDNNYFIIIIGSGPAGLTTALELEKRKIKSLILEAGNFKNENNPEEYLKGKIIGDEYTDISYSRLRQFGGTSSIWGGNCNPMYDQDLKEWPINSSELQKYNQVTREILNLDKKENFFLEKFNNNLNYYNIIWSNVKFGEKYLDHVKKSNYIHLCTNTIFENFEGNSKTIDLINCVNGNEKIKLKSKYYILACGGIENSRLLLWSKEINKNMFNAKMPIGKYYMDHPFHNVGEGLIFFEPFVSYFKKNNLKFKPHLTCNNNFYISGDSKFIKNQNIINSGLYIDFDTKNVNNIFKQVRCLAPKFIKNIYENLNNKDKYKISISTLQEQESDINNKIILGKKKDPHGIPYPTLYWKKSFLERKSVRILGEEFSKVLIENNIGRINLNTYLYNDDNYDVVVGNHQLGGTRIGDNISDSVVDRNLKIHDKNNLFINGSSVFRTAGHCHPTYTIVSLASRLADHLSKI
ncbi:GMC oxidoreductase [Candidatus Pelagibacter sp.]|nr:GMC oxidoreductase [Candidatus Pelagibacter sp.]